MVNLPGLILDMGYKIGGGCRRKHHANALNSTDIKE
jgi:hypothetical protein